MHLRKFLLSTTLLLPVLVLHSFIFVNKASGQSSKLVFSFVSYEYGKPLQKNTEDFAVRRIYEVYDNKEMKVIDKLYDGYEKTTNIKLGNSLFRKLTSLHNLSSLRTRIKLEEGVYYAGAYDYILINKESKTEDLCFIIPLVSDKLAKLISSLYSINLKAGQQENIIEIPAEVDLYKAKIIPLHKQSFLPQITLVPTSF